MRLLTSAVVLTILPASLVAQNAYRRTPGDTLRYDERTKIISAAQTPMGEMTTEANSEGATTFAFRTADSVTVTLHPTKLTMKLPTGEYSPEMGGFTGSSYEVLMKPNGELKVLSQPDLPEALAGINSSVNALDFFVRLPAKRLSSGAVWTDTAEFHDSTAVMRMKIRRVASYKVEKDTVVDGSRAWIIAGTGDGSLESAGSGTTAGGSVEVSMTIKDTDRAVITHDGLMLSRDLVMEQSGVSRIVMASMPMDMPVTGTIELKRRLVR